MSGGPFVRAVGVVCHAGSGIAALRRALADPDWKPEPGLARPDAPPLPVAVCRDFTTRDVLPPLLARRLDRPARLLAVAAREALLQLGDPLPWDPERVGVAAATWNAGTSALVEVLRAVFLACPEEAPPAQFPSTVANAPASQLGILAKLGGPNVTFAEKQAGGARAVIEAARLLDRGRADAVIAAGVDEGDWLNAEGYLRLGALARANRPGMLLAEGAAVLVLAREPGPAPLARVAGCGSASSPAPPHRYPDQPTALLAASHQALARAGLTPDAIDVVICQANGSPALAALELTAWGCLFGDHRPAVLAPAERLGEGAVSPALRALVATLALAGQVSIAWPPPPELGAAGFPPMVARPQHALVTAVAGGGATEALVLSRA
ncbi:MAG: beta-ketoacyl synthase N-terminal-like domain-containing protein [Thermoanaerobaculales bacterium]